MAGESERRQLLAGDVVKQVFGMAYLMEELALKILVIEAKVLNPQVGPEALVGLAKGELDAMRERVTGRQMAKVADYQDGPN